MPNLECPICKTRAQTAEPAAQPIRCPACGKARTAPFDGLPVWPSAMSAMLPGARRNMMADDDDDDDGDDDDKVSEKPQASKKGKGRDDDEDGDDDKPKKKKGGMGMGMIIGIVAVLLVCCVCTPIGGVVGFMFLGIGNLQKAAGNVVTINNMKQISLSCHSYNDANKNLPPPRMAQAELSWRVDILPYNEQINMFQQFDKTKDWNNAANQRFTTMMPNLYVNTSKQSAQENSKTHFQYFTGPNTLFPEKQTKISLSKIKDGASNTFLFADALTPVTWSEPRDMTAQPLTLPPDRFLVAMCDATVRTIDRKKADDNVLRNLINPNDGQAIPPSVLD